VWDEAAEALLERWIALAGPGGATYGRDLVNCYLEPHRRYHTTEHLAHVLDVVDLLEAEAAQADAVRYAGWFHDAVYEIGVDTKLSNEERSARLAEAVLRELGAPADLVTEVGRLVRHTADHRIALRDRNGAVLCDADLSVLGGTPEDYLRYAAQVREEYREIPGPQFRSGRAAILRDLLGRDAIYRTHRARELFELAARENLTAEIARLTG
jgi:predicted metal-dependent HD superfamily phosphohydrolase